MGEYVSIPGVPESITRKQFLALVEGAGFDVKDLQSLSFERDGIYAEVLATDEEGRHFTIDGENVATHQVCVRVVDEPDAGERPQR